jgi:hypothetical protein
MRMIGSARLPFSRPVTSRWRSRSPAATPLRAGRRLPGGAQGALGPSGHVGTGGARRGQGGAALRPAGRRVRAADRHRQWHRPGAGAHPAIKAVGFTGSRSGGTALMAVAAARKQPIPVYAEMSSINPVFLLPHALAARGAEIATGFAASLTMGVGQFCTNPGLVLGIAGPEFDRFAPRPRRWPSSKPAPCSLPASPSATKRRAQLGAPRREDAGAGASTRKARVLRRCSAPAARPSWPSTRCIGRESSARPRCWWPARTWPRCARSPNAWKAS